MVVQLLVTLLDKHGVSACKWRHLVGLARVKQEVHETFVFGLDDTALLALIQPVLHRVLDRDLFLADGRELLLADVILLGLGLLLVLKIARDSAIDPVFEVTVQLILERVLPMLLLGKMLDAVHEVVGEESLRQVEALQLLDRLELLLSLHASRVKRLILEPDALNFLDHFLLPF